MIRARNTLALVATTLISAQALLAGGGAAGPEIENPAQDTPIEWYENALLYEGIAFVLLLVILAKFVLPLVLKGMNAREESFAKRIEEAKALEKEGKELKAKHEKMMAEANAQAKKIADDAIATAEKAGQKIVDEAKKAASEIVERAREDIRLDQNRALAEIRQQAVELSLMASSAVLSKALDDGDHRRLAEEAISAAASSMSGKN